MSKNMAHNNSTISTSTENTRLSEIIRTETTWDTENWDDKEKKWGYFYLIGIFYWAKNKEKIGLKCTKRVF